MRNNLHRSKLNFWALVFSLSALSFSQTLLMANGAGETKPISLVVIPAAEGNVPSRATRGHGGPNIKTEILPDQIKVDFENKRDSDDYVHIDFGPVELNDYSSGGCLEFTAECTNPIIQAAVLISSPELFWETRLTIEGLFTLRKGTHTYRVYFDSIIPSRRETMSTDRVFLQLRDMKNTGIGKSELKITHIAFLPSEPNWQSQKKLFYTQQWPPFPDYERIEDAYREDFERGVNWEEISSSPFVSFTSMNGEWMKQSFGEHFWDLSFLQDISYAQMDFDDSKWKRVEVPEAPIADQAGGYFWYRKEFTVNSVRPGEKVYLRLGDISEDGSIYLNGQLVGTQSSVDKSLKWLGSGLGRTVTPPGSSLGDVMNTYFDRYEIEMPFSKDAMPKDAERMAFPISSGEFSWPLAYDVTDLIQSGKNVLAVRIHGNPLRGYWIYRYPNSRASANIFGILGKVELATQQAPVIKEFKRIAPKWTQSDGTASHHFIFELNSAELQATQAIFMCEGESIAVPLVASENEYQVQLSLPARFMDYAATLTILNDNGTAIDQRSLNFHGAVIGLQDGQLAVNGDPFLVRGIVAQYGVEWSNDRKVTRREFQRLLRTYEQMGINTLRMDTSDYWQIEMAFEHGFMVIPILSSASTDLSGAVFGRVEDPDLELIWDRQRLGILLYREANNILIWNTGNEISHVPGMDDFATVETFLQGLPDIYERYDPDGRLMMYSSYDAWMLGWFFTDGDIVGWNYYGTSEQLDREINSPERMKVYDGKPFLFTEWGVDLHERGRDVEKWEKMMREKWLTKISTKNCLGGILYAWHGEMNDDRGREFIGSLYSPFTIERYGPIIRILNRGEAPMREVSILAVRNTDVFKSEYVGELAPGEHVNLHLPRSDPWTLELRYDTHRGLKHFYSKELE